ncbi:hypothetical protein [Lysinibacillus fusiformis]|uniref:hypothetical protein n=1 Tax=Lysinibacillus fusiformis TaxID=28031 RepID=UPI003D07E44B
MTTFAVMEVVRNDMGVPVAHVWHERISGHLMTEREAHELRTMLAASASTTGSTCRSSYRVCAWADASQYKEGAR